MACSDITLLTVSASRMSSRMCMVFLLLQEVKQHTDINSLLELENPFYKEEKTSTTVKPSTSMG